MKARSLFLLIATTLSLAACGSSGGGNGGTASAQNYQGGACGQQVIDDYNNMVITCEGMVSDSDARACKSQAQNFLNRYPGISCQAQRVSDGSTYTIQASTIQSVVDKLSAMGY